jgi:DNA (cytosine-5)-methyltransferase 1
MNKFTFIDLFAGIGGFHFAAKSLGGKCLFASETDAYAKKAYEANYGIKVSGDITKIKASDIPTHDMLFAGFPCQPFSIIGKRLGFEDIRGTLFFEIIRILKAKQPSTFILENVKQLAAHNKKQTINRIIESLETLGYKVSWRVLNALDYGLPQKRERVIIVGFLNNSVEFKWPCPKKEYIPLSKIIESKVDKKHYASDKICEKRRIKHKSKYSLAIWHENKGGNVTSYPYSCALRAGASYNYLLVNGKRRLTPREMLRLQGFPETFKIVCSDCQTKKQVGNAVPVTIIKAVIKEIIHATSEIERCKRENRKRIISSRRIFERSNIRNQSKVSI